MEKKGDEESKQGELDLDETQSQPPRAQEISPVPSTHFKGETHKENESSHTNTDDPSQGNNTKPTFVPTE